MREFVREEGEDGNLFNQEFKKDSLQLNGKQIAISSNKCERKESEETLKRRKRFDSVRSSSFKLNLLNDKELGFPTKVIWGMFLVVSTCLCVFMVVNNVNEFRRYEVNTKIRIVDDKPAKFPEIAICNKNPFVSNKASEFLNQFRIDTGDDNTNDPVRVDLWQASLQAKNPTFGDENRRSLGLTMQDMLIKCSFVESRCTPEDFQWFYDWDFGNCYRFNSGRNATGHPTPIRTIQRAGRFAGLYLQLFIGRPQRKYLTEITSGILLVVNNQTFPLSIYEGINAQPGTITNIDVKRVFTHRKDKPHSDCEKLDNFKSLLFDEVAKTGYSYRQKDCFDLCKQQACVGKCKCYDLRYPKLFNATPCLNQTQIECSELIYEYFLNEDINKMCSSECPLECDSISYELSLSTANFPTRIFSKILKQRDTIKSQFEPNETISYESLKECVLALDINYAELKYKVISESASKTIIDLIASIGGTIGLFLGTSLLGIVDIIESAFKLIISIKIRRTNDLIIEYI